MGTDPAALKAESPLAHAGSIRVPVLLVHGEDDYTVLADQSRAMDRELSREGVPHELILIKHGEHSLLQPDMRLTLYRKVTEFLRVNLAEPPEAPGAAPRSGTATTR
jgi:dipeptidyl aminopeptidase/acylaminoacyl peptidase